MAKCEVKRWWISRDGVETDFYQFHHMHEKPKTIAGSVYPSESAIMLMRGKDFQQVYAFHLRKGTCEEIEQPILVLKT